MPVDLKAVKKALGDFSTFAKNFGGLFQDLPKGLLDFATKIK